MNLKYSSFNLYGERGPIGPDGNPIGTVISYMGKTAPKDYLVCDGQLLDISKYLDLANFFEIEFGAKNHFGGDGVNTFAVPDLRNMFLRGYHGEAEEQLSEDVGARQEGTIHPNIYIGSSVTDYNPVIQAMGESPQIDSNVQNIDTIIKSSTKRRNASMMSEVYDQVETPITYTSRPVNTAVLYCIKAVESIGYAADDYFLDEQRIGTWIDGKPLYRQVVEFTLPKNQPSTNIDVYNFGVKLNVVKFEGFLHQLSARGFHDTCQQIASSHGTNFDYYCGMVMPELDDGKTHIIISMGKGDVMQGAPAYVIVEYTKTTD